MRPLTSALLIATLLAAAPAAAEQAGWVDPPVKGSANGAAGQAGNETAKPEAKPQAEPDAAQAAKESRAAEASARRPKATEIKREARPLVAPNASEPRASDRAGTAQRLAAAYLGAVSAPGAAMVAAAPRFYGERVRFHGRLMSLSALIAEKSRFVQRWPERRYAPHGAMQTHCEGEICRVRTAFDFRAQSTARAARSQGSGELILTIDFTDGRPRIVSESSRVLRYGGPMLGQAERPARGA